jgi:hypothetical protein
MKPVLSPLSILMEDLGGGGSNRAQRVTDYLSEYKANRRGEAKGQEDVEKRDFVKGVCTI